MGSLQSPVDRIQSVNWQKFPAKPVAMEKIVRIGRSLYGIGVGGCFYTDSGMERNMFLLDHTVDQHSVIALQKLGVITRAQVEEHNVPCRRYNEIVNLLYAIEVDFERLAAAGVKVDPREKAKLTRRLAKLEDSEIPYWYRREYKDWKKRHESKRAQKK